MTYQPNFHINHKSTADFTGSFCASFIVCKMVILFASAIVERCEPLVEAIYRGGISQKSRKKEPICLFTVLSQFVKSK